MCRGTDVHLKHAVGRCVDARRRRGGHGRTGRHEGVEPSSHRDRAGPHQVGDPDPERSHRDDEHLRQGVAAEDGRDAGNAGDHSNRKPDSGEPLSEHLALVGGFDNAGNQPVGSPDRAHQKHEPVEDHEQPADKRRGRAERRQRMEEEVTEKEGEDRDRLVRGTGGAQHLRHRRRICGERQACGRGEKHGECNTLAEVQRIHHHGPLRQFVSSSTDDTSGRQACWLSDVADAFLVEKRASW